MKLLPLEKQTPGRERPEVSGADQLIAQAKAVAESAANALAQHLGIKCRNTEFWDGKLYTTFLAAHPGQECLPAIHNAAPDGEWEADDEEEREAPSMSMSG